MRRTTVGDRAQHRQSPPTSDNQGEWHTRAEWVLLPAKYIPRILEIVREWDEFDAP